MVGFWENNGNQLVLGSIARDLSVHVIKDKLAMEAVGIAVTPTQQAFYYAYRGSNAHELVRRERGDGTEVVVAGGISPVSFAISQDHKHLAYSTCRETKSIARLRDDGRPVELMPRGTSRDTKPTPLDASRLVFESDRSGASQIWLFDEKTHAARALTGRDTWMAALSTDRRWLA